MPLAISLTDIKAEGDKDAENSDMMHIFYIHLLNHMACWTSPQEFLTFNDST